MLRDLIKALWLLVITIQTHVSYFEVTGTPVLDFCWHLLWISKPEWVLPYTFFAEVNVMYIPQDPPLMLQWYPLGGWCAAGHFPTCMCRGGTWLGFKQAITQTDSECASIVQRGMLCTFPKIHLWSYTPHVCFSIGRNWLGIERAITHPEDECATIVQATLLQTDLSSFSLRLK